MKPPTTLRRAVLRIIRDLEAMPPAERAYEGRLVIEGLYEAVNAISGVRAKAARDLKADGLTWAEVGDLLGISAMGARQMSIGHMRQYRARRRERERAAAEAAASAP